MAQLASQRQHVFRAPSVEERLKEAAGCSLSGWVIEFYATSSEDIAKRTALCQRCLKPCVTTLNCYKTRLNRQAQGASVPILKRVPILLVAGEDEGKYDNEIV